MDERFVPLNASEISIAYRLVEDKNIFCPARVCDILKEICGIPSLSVPDMKYLVQIITQVSNRGGSEEFEEEEDEDIEGITANITDKKRTTVVDKHRRSSPSDIRGSFHTQRTRSRSVTADTHNRQISNRSATAEPSSYNRRMSHGGHSEFKTAKGKDLNCFLNFTTTTFDDKHQEIPTRSLSSSNRSSFSTLSVSREDFQKFLLHGFLPTPNDEDFFENNEVSARNSICGFIVNPSPRSTISSHRKSSSISSQITKLLSSPDPISSSTALPTSNQAIPSIRIGSATSQSNSSSISRKQISPRNRNKDSSTITANPVVPLRTNNIKNNSMHTSTYTTTTATIRPTTPPPENNNSQPCASEEPLSYEELAATTKAIIAKKKAAQWSKIRSACRAYHNRLNAELLAAETRLLQNLFSNASEGGYKKFGTQQYTNLLLKFFKFHPIPPSPSDIEKAAEVLVQLHTSKSTPTTPTCSDPSSSTSLSPSTMTTKRAKSMTKEDFFNLFYGTEHP